MSTEIKTPNHRAHPLRVLIADDMPQVRQDLRVLLELSEQVQVVGEAANGQEAIALAEQLCPDVVVMDLEMPVMDGITATRAIKRRGSAGRIIILSVHADLVAVQRAREAGAEVFIDKAACSEVLLSVLVTSSYSLHSEKGES